METETETETENENVNENINRNRINIDNKIQEENMDVKKLILDTVESDGYVPLSPYDMHTILSQFGVDESEFWRALSSLELDYEIQFTKKGKIAKASDMGFFKAKISASSRGDFGFAITEDGDFFVPPKFMRGAYHGDTVVIKRIDYLSKYYGKGNEAEVVEILSRGTDETVGTLTIYSNGRRSVAYVTPENERLHLKIKVNTKNLEASDGDKVVVRLNAYPKDESDFALGEIVEVLGRSDSLEGNYRAILHANGISTSFSEETIDEARSVSVEPLNINGRLDLRNETVFTIDGADAKDLDDAISLRVTENGYILGVHIADVSHYVRSGSHLDKEAIERGTSVYFTDKVVPMLPKELSNGICSLNGGEDRLTLSCFITLDKSGAMVSSEIRKSVINSKMRGVYSELNDILENGENSEFYSKYSHIMDDFNEMMKLYRILRQRSEVRGAMELESDEVKIVLDDCGLPIKIEKRERGESERLIEQFMLCANEAVATYMYNACIPCVFRVHEEPDREKINSFAIFARNLGVDVSPLRTKNTITPSQLARVLESAEKKGYSAIASSVLLRALMKAKYSSVQRPHFGLNTEYYCHFTSPIRRYPDLSVHRILKSFLDGRLDSASIERYERFANLSAELSSENEVKAIHAEREIEQLYKCVYMQGLEGEEMEAVISSVASFGLFAKTENLCEGLISVDSLGGGFYFDKDNYTLSRGKTTYRLGQKIKIRVDTVDISLRQINFELVREKKQENDVNEEENEENSYSIPSERLSKEKQQRERAFSHKKSVTKHRQNKHSQRKYRR